MPALFIIWVGLPVTLCCEKLVISTRCILFFYVQLDQKNLERTLLLTLLLSQLHCRVWFGLPAATVCANFYKIDWLKFDRWTLIVIYRVICKNNRRHLCAWNIGLMKRWIAQSHYHKSRSEVHQNFMVLWLFLLFKCLMRMLLYF